MFLAYALTALSIVAVCPVLGQSGRFLAPLEGIQFEPKYPDFYLITLYNNQTLEGHYQAIGLNLSSFDRFRRFTFGYEIAMNSTIRDEFVRRDPGVRMVETNTPAYGIEPHDVREIDPSQLARSSNSSNLSRSALSKRAYRTAFQPDAPWGLQMLVTPQDRLDTPIQNEGPYDYLANAGQGVQVYVLDTGIRTSHVRFERRARHFGGLGKNDKSPYVDDTMQDVRGHGTHVAGTIGAEQYGVAPLATLVNVKVLDNADGHIRSSGDVAQAIIDVTAEHISNREKSKSDPNHWNFRGSVINMSLVWYSFPEAVRYQLEAANEAGISIFAAAGNQNEDSSNWYPCSNIETSCVAAIDNTYNKYGWSNHGGTVGLVAPGVKIRSLGVRNDIDIAEMTGTSMATAHASGAAAIFTSWRRAMWFNTDWLSHQYVDANSIAGLVSGFGSDNPKTWLVTTGIFSSRKYPNEPFRWASDDPVSLLSGDDPADSVTVNWQTATEPASVPTSDFITLYTDMQTSTVVNAPALETTIVTLTDPDDNSPPTTSTAFPDEFPAPTPSCATTGTSFAQAPVQSLITTFCAEPELNAEFVPYIGFGNGSTQFGRPKSLNAEGKFMLPGTSNVAWLRTRFVTESCTGSFNGTYQCNQLFSTILNGCGTNTVDAKLGGTLQSGCGQYTLTVVDSHTDPFTDRDAPVGDFTCEDTQPPNDVNTCTCWMSLRQSQTALFAKPANGQCNGQSVDRKNGLVAGQGY